MDDIKLKAGQPLLRMRIYDSSGNYSGTSIKSVQFLANYFYGTASFNFTTNLVYGFTGTYSGVTYNKYSNRTVTYNSKTPIPVTKQDGLCLFWPWKPPTSAKETVLVRYVKITMDDGRVCTKYFDPSGSNDGTKGVNLRLVAGAMYTMNIDINPNQPNVTDPSFFADTKYSTDGGATWEDSIPSSAFSSLAVKTVSGTISAVTLGDIRSAMDAYGAEGGVDLDLSQAKYSSTAFPATFAGTEETGYLKLKSIKFPSNVVSIDEGAFQWCEGLKSVELDGITTIKSRAFYHSGLVDLTVPRTVVSIPGVLTFGCLDYLESLYYDSPAPQVGGVGSSGTNHAVFAHSKLDDDTASPAASANLVTSSRNSSAYPCEVTFGPNASVATRYMFTNNRKVTRVTFKGRLVTIANYAFSGMPSCAVYDLSGITTPSKAGSSPGSGSGTDVSDGDRKILVPQGCTEAYKAADPWKAFIAQDKPYAIEEVPVVTGSGDITVRAGSFNIRIESADTGENAWAVRAPKTVQAILNCNFDIFGLQEVQTVQQNSLISELGDIYDFAFFCANTSDKRSSTGIAWKKADYDVSGISTFWISPTPDTMGAYDTGSTGTYYRGAITGTVTHKATGVKFFFMCTHGCLQQTPNETYAYLYIDKEKELNPARLPSLFVGDMNALPTWASSALWRTYWTDTWAGIEESKRSGPEYTYNGFAYPDGKPEYRIDFLYWRGTGITPLSYTCDNTLIDGGYPSDHFPIWADYRIVQ